MLMRLVLAIQNKRLEKQIIKTFSQSDVHIVNVGNQPDTWRKLVKSCGDVVVISESFLPSSSESAISLLNELPEKPTSVLLHNSDSSVDHAKLVAAGADVVLYSGVPLKNLVEAIETTLDTRRDLFMLEHFDAQGRVKPSINDFVSECEEMQIFMEEVHRIIQSNSNLLILGETGVGKEHLAKAIHNESPRSGGPFVTVNTAAIPDQLLESELFGHEQGAFTGAVRSRRGAFEQAHNGTIFLDEIGEMPLHLQVKLLRVLQDYEIHPLGGEKSVFVDVRVIAATNKDLEFEMSQGNFRKDLFYRLSILTLTIPPLRNRKEDILTLVLTFLDHFKRKIGKEVNKISESAEKALCGYKWPGNIRELMNVLERAVILCKSDTISLEDLPSTLYSSIKPTQKNSVLNINYFEHLMTDKTLPEVQKEILYHIEKHYLQMVLKSTSGRVGAAAKIAGIHQRALYNKMKNLNLNKEDFKN